MRQNLLPFGAGTRVCLGEALAKKRIFLFTVALYQRYELRPHVRENLPIWDCKLMIGDFFRDPATFNVRAIRRK